MKKEAFIEWLKEHADAAEEVEEDLIRITIDDHYFEVDYLQDGVVT